MGERTKVLEGKVNDCTRQLNQLKESMKKQTGLAYKSSKQKALTILKRRKMYEAQLNSVLNQQFNIDQVQFTSESIQGTLDMAAGMKQATLAQKQLMKGMNLDNLEDLHDEMQDMMEDQEEIQEILGRDYAMGEDYDEEEIEAELEALDGEIVSEKLDENPAVDPLSQPQAPIANDKDEMNNIMNN